jgi:hypothetical protein
MPYLLQAAFWVGVVGTVAATPLLYLMRMEGAYQFSTPYQWGAPAILFLTAALAFMATYAMLPTSRWRTRVAGVLAGVITFFCFSIITAFVMNSGRGFPDYLPGILRTFTVVFVLAGWIPLGGGWLAGWLVSKLPDAPAEEAT